jgi:hypothetical protein
VMTNRSDRGSAKPRGSQRFERDDVIREPACGLHQGQQPNGAARTGRTHGCTRPVLIAEQKLLRRRGRPHMTPNIHSIAIKVGGRLPARPRLNPKVRADVRVALGMPRCQKASGGQVSVRTMSRIPTGDFSDDWPCDNARCRRNRHEEISSA